MWRWRWVWALAAASVVAGDTGDAGNTEYEGGPARGDGGDECAQWRAAAAVRLPPTRRKAQPKTLLTLQGRMNQPRTQLKQNIESNNA